MLISLPGAFFWRGNIKKFVSRSVWVSLVCSSQSLVCLQGELYCLPLVLCQSSSFIVLPLSRVPLTALCCTAVMLTRVPGSLSTAFWTGRAGGRSVSPPAPGSMSKAAWRRAERLVSPPDGCRPAARTASSDWCHSLPPWFDTLWWCPSYWAELASNLKTTSQIDDAVAQQQYWYATKPKQASAVAAKGKRWFCFESWKCKRFEFIWSKSMNIMVSCMFCAGNMTSPTWKISSETSSDVESHVYY